MAKKKNIPDIRFKGFSDEWEEKILGELGSVVMNKRIFKNQTLDEGDIPFYKIGTFGSLPNAFISRDLFEEYKSKYPYPEKGDILISASGSIGRIVEYMGKDEYFQDSNIVWLQHDGRIQNLFLKYFYSVVKWSGLEGSTIKRLYNKNILDTAISLPQPKEQTKIGNYFKNLDQLITQHQQKYDKLLTIKKAMLKKMFPQNGATVPEIRFKGFTEDWEVKALEELTTFIVDNRGKNPIYYCSNGIPVIDNYMIKNKPYPNLSEANRFIDDYLFENFIRKYNKVDDILITLVGNGIGNITLFPEQKCVIIQNTLGLRFSCYQKFMFYSLLSNRRQIIKLDRGMAQPSIRQDELLEVSIYCPKAEEQKKIGDYFTHLDNLITLNKQKLEKLKTIKKALLNKMFV